MNKKLFESIKESLPNFPDYVIEHWILPYAEELGWPPLGGYSERWHSILTLSLEEWREADWKFESIDLQAIPWSYQAQLCINQMTACYIGNVDNAYSTLKTEGNGMSRFFSAYRYLLEQGTFPQPIIIRQDFEFMSDNVEQFRVMDGNHRVLSWYGARKLYQELSQIEPEEHDSLKRKLNISCFAPLQGVQDMWVARF